MCFPLKLSEWNFLVVRLFGVAAITWLAAGLAQGQIIYLSDNRSVSAVVGFDTNSLAQQEAVVLSYSGVYSASASPSSPFADFSTYQSGSATVSYTYLMASFTNTWTAEVGVGQSSFLNAQGISYSSSVNEGANARTASCLQASFLQVIFMVSDAVTYNLTCQRGPDPFFSNESWTLSSINLGLLVGTPPLNGPNNGYGPAASYSGLLVPSDTYTLTLQETGGVAPPPYGDFGGLQVFFSVPEPSVGSLLSLALCGLVAIRLSRSPRQFARVTSGAKRRDYAHDKRHDKTGRAVSPLPAERRD